MPSFPKKKKSSTATGNWIHKDDIYNKNDVTLSSKKLIGLCEKKKKKLECETPVT